MSFDPNAYRRASLEDWEAAAGGWTRRQEEIRGLGGPASRWMLEAVSPRPGQRVLELAAGLGETGMLAAERLGPGGEVVISDQAEAMLAGARERARSLGLANVEFRVLDAEWIDLPLASVDAVLCRWGYMLMADPAAALRETRRVLRPGGRLALAVWDALSHNPWAALPAQELIERGLAPVPGGEGFRPGPFALDSVVRLAELLGEAGFEDLRIQRLELTRTHSSFQEFWETTLDLSRSFHDVVLARPAEEIAEIRDSMARRMAQYSSAQGRLEVPARTLVASARA